MINLRITMVSGQDFVIRNFAANSVVGFIKMVLMPNRTQLNWYEIIPGNFIQVSQIQGIEKLEDKEPEEDKPEVEDGEEIVLPKDKDNKEIEETSEPENSETETPQ